MSYQSSSATICPNHQITYRQILGYLGTTLVQTPRQSRLLRKSPCVIDTRAVVTRGTGKERKHSQGDANRSETRSPGLSVTLIESNLTPKSRDKSLYLGPLSTVIRLFKQSLVYYLRGAINWPEICSPDPLKIRAGSKGFSDENMYRQEMGIRKLWIGK